MIVTPGQLKKALQDYFQEDEQGTYFNDDATWVNRENKDAGVEIDGLVDLEKLAGKLNTVLTDPFTGNGGA